MPLRLSYRMRRCEKEIACLAGALVFVPCERSTAPQPWRFRGARGSLLDEGGYQAFQVQPFGTPPHWEPLHAHRRFEANAPVLAATFLWQPMAVQRRIMWKVVKHIALDFSPVSSFSSWRRAWRMGSVD